MIKKMEVLNAHCSVLFFKSAHLLNQLYLFILSELLSVLCMKIQEGLLLWIFIHDTDKVEEGLILLLYFGLFIRSSPLEIFLPTPLNLT